MVEVCMLCRRSYETSDPALIPIESGGSGRVYRMFRFPDRTIHQFRTNSGRGKKRNLIPAGSFVTPKPQEPTSAPIETIINVPAQTASVSIDDAAARLDKHFHTPEPQEKTRKIPTTEYGDYEESPEPMLGDIVDCIVVSWGRRDPTGMGRSAIGLARVIVPGRKNRKGSTDGLFMRETNVVTEGEIRVGVKIRAKLAPPESDAHIFSLVHISIYED